MQKVLTSDWKLGLLTAIAITFLAIYPQLNFWIARGSEWKGSFVLVQGDEIAYSAYINALIDGRPRKNDTFMGRDDSQAQPLQESLFSIQLLPAYAIALPARLLHISASSAFIILICLIGCLSSLALFFLLKAVTGSAHIAAVGTLAILCLGTLAAGQGEISVLLYGEYIYDFFPFLRRYQPGLSFPLFFVFCTFVWQSMTVENRKRAFQLALAAGVTLSILVFSYFYMWTAALAWVGCFAALCLAARFQERSRILVTSGIVFVFGIAAIVPFFILLSHRAKTMDSTQLLTLSHAPALKYPAEFIALAVLAILLFAARRGRNTDWHSPLFLIATSFVVTPFVLFNQQVITGMSLQPIHYELFIANYLVLLGLVLAGLIAWREFQGVERPIPGRVLVYGAVIALTWGMVEVAGSTKRNAPYARIRDDSMPAIRTLADFAHSTGDSDQAVRSGQASYPIVYSTNLNTAGNVPTASPMGVLWAEHTPASGVSLSESKRRYYYYLYYSGADDKALAIALAEKQFNTMTALFGIERVVPTLSAMSRPITVDEMREEIRSYSNFASSFSKQNAGDPMLSYVLAPAIAEPDYSNLDRWYQRDEGLSVGIYRIYKLKLKD